MSLLSLFVIFLSFFQGATVSSTQIDANTVKNIEDRFTAALLKRDHNEFGELLADDLTHIGFEGQVAGKAEYMSFFKQGAWQYKKYQPSNVTVKVLGSVAVVTGQVDRTIVINGHETKGAFAFTHVWAQAESRWRLTSSHVTTVSNPAAK